MYDPHGEVGVGEKLDRLRLVRAGEEQGDVLFRRPLDKERGNLAGAGAFLSDHDAGGM